MLVHYNLAIENEYLKNYSKSCDYYEQCSEIAKSQPQTNADMINNCKQSIEKIHQEKKNAQRREAMLIKRRKQQQEKGNHEYMRRNIRHFKTSEAKSAMYLKYEPYKAENEEKRTQQPFKLAKIDNHSKDKNFSEGISQPFLSKTKQRKTYRSSQKMKTNSILTDRA